jgi:hypothetical protein
MRSIRILAIITPVLALVCGCQSTRYPYPPEPLTVFGTITGRAYFPEPFPSRKSEVLTPQSLLVVVDAAAGRSVVLSLAPVAVSLKARLTPARTHNFEYGQTLPYDRLPNVLKVTDSEGQVIYSPASGIYGKDIDHER